MKILHLNLHLHGQNIYTWHCVNVKSRIWLLESINVCVNHLH
jgi:hypothetical protein